MCLISPKKKMWQIFLAELFQQMRISTCDNFYWNLHTNHIPDHFDITNIYVDHQEPMKFLKCVPEVTCTQKDVVDWIIYRKRCKDSIGVLLYICFTCLLKCPKAIRHISWKGEVANGTEWVEVNEGDREKQIATLKPQTLDGCKQIETKILIQWKLENSTRERKREMDGEYGMCLWQYYRVLVELLLNARTSIRSVDIGQVDFQTLTDHRQTNAMASTDTHVHVCMHHT